MSPQWLALLEPFILLQPIGHDKVPMFFWGPLFGPGAAKKKDGCSASQPPIFIFSFTGLDPDGCLVADQRKVHTITIENSGADKQKGLIPIWRLIQQKKDIIFCDGGVFFLDRGLLMGANI